MLEKSINASVEGAGPVQDYKNKSIFNDEAWLTLLEASKLATDRLSNEEKAILDTLNILEAEEEARLGRRLTPKELEEFESKVDGSKEVVDKGREIFYQILSTNGPKGTTTDNVS